ncbi:hypothetical protein NC652_023527 [Populus alba x Populus x berolinensis]|nr:hypothetical protein NC652_023527 [Populus alba x Populus x berolinensis]
MGGGNGQKSKMARERNMEKQKAAKGSQLESNKKAMSIQSGECLETCGEFGPGDSGSCECNLAFLHEVDKASIIRAWGERIIALMRG